MSDTDCTDFHGTNPCQSVKSVSASFVVNNSYPWIRARRAGCRAGLPLPRLEPYSPPVDELNHS